MARRGRSLPIITSFSPRILGIEIEVIADGLVSGDMLRYAKQYNSLMTAEIQRRYGPDILQEARRRAQIMQEQIEKSPKL